MERNQRIDIFDGIVLSILMAMIVLAPVAMGAVAPWAKNTLFVLSLLMTLVWFLQAARLGKLVLVREPIFLLIGFFVLVVCLQLIPLPAGIIETVSPTTAEVYERTLPDEAGSGAARTLSLNPYHTSWELRRVITVFLVFLVIVNTFRTRTQVLAVIIAMITVGAFEAMYGFVEYVEGSKNILWNERVVSRNAVAGTFINKNHFAGLLEMVVPVTVGLCMALAPRSIRGGSFKVKALESLSSKRIHHQVILGILVVVMTIAIFFSLSRAGTSAAVGAWIPFFLFLGMTTGARKYTLAVLLLVVATLCLFLGGDTDKVVIGIEEVAVGESLSWEARLDLWNSSLTMVGHYPVLGTGLGTFKEAFERFQSPRFGDKSAAFAHNDWLQVICETGVIGGLIAIAGILLLFVSLTRKTVGRRDVFCRWIATGALAGCLAMLIHSFFDFNLYKITSNSIVFAAVVGIWFVAVNMPGKSRHSHAKNKTMTLPLRSTMVRYGFGVVAVALFGVLAIQPVRSAVADIHLNRYLAATDTKLEQPRLYFFFPIDDAAKIDPAHELARARVLDSQNPLLVYLEGIQKVRDANAIVLEQARTVTNIAAGDEAVGTDLTALEQVIFRQIAAGMAVDRKPFLDATERSLREAIALAPSKSAYHILLAEVLAEKGNPEDGMSSAVEEANLALWLAPGKPRSLFESGKAAFLASYDRDDPGGNPVNRVQGLNSLKRCLAIDPVYAEQVYALMEEAYSESDPLFAVTPDRIDAYEQLTEILWERDDLEAVLRSLDKTEALCVESNGDQTTDDAGRLEARIKVAQKRTSVLGLLGRFDERKQSARMYRALVRQNDSEDLTNAYILREEGKYRQSFRKVLEILGRDWSNPQSLVLAADLSLKAGVTSQNALDSFPLDHLRRVILLNDAIPPKVLGNVRIVLDQVSRLTDSKRRYHALISGAVSILGGDPETGISILEESLESGGEEWINEHLVWYFLGRGYEKIERLPEASRAYREVVAVVSTHFGASERLAELDPGFRGGYRLEKGFVTDVDFGGKVILHGYRFDRKTGSNGQPALHVTLLWEVADRMSESCRIRLDFLDESRDEVLLSSSRVIREMIEPPVFYCGQIVEQELELEETNGAAAFLRIRVFPENLPPLPADNGKNETTLKVLR